MYLDAPALRFWKVAVGGRVGRTSHRFEELHRGLEKRWEPYRGFKKAGKATLETSFEDLLVLLGDCQHQRIRAVPSLPALPVVSVSLEDGNWALVGAFPSSPDSDLSITCLTSEPRGS